MARNVFISFRFSDGKRYKDRLVELFEQNEDIYDYSEDEDRSKLSEVSIKNFLYSKLKQTTVTVVLLTPQAINHQVGLYGRIDDWMYDEIRYSLEEREGNKTNGLIGVYVPEAESMIFTKSTHRCNTCKKESEVLRILEFNNLVRKNMMNIKDEYKRNPCLGIFDSDYDSYCSLISFNDFCNNPNMYIDIAYEKRSNLYKYRDLVKRL